MADDISALHTNYINNYLIAEIVENLPDETLESYDFKHSSGLDGFMSALYNIDLKTKQKDGSLKERFLIAKFMKGDVAFRESSKSYIQFANEVYVYASIMPEYEKIMRHAEQDDLSINNWVARSYVAKFGYVEGLSATKQTRESVLVLDNLKPQGYTLGPRLYLSLEQLFEMCTKIGEFHAMSFVLRETNPTLLDRLKSGIVPLPFYDESNDGKNVFTVLYRVAFDRFFEYFDRKINDNTFDRKSAKDIKLIERVRVLREKYFEQPTKLLEHLKVSIEEREEDRRFGAILHGDYNRNNVLFLMKKLDQPDVPDIVKNLRMIDFQELRYGSPALDLSFFMYFNTTEEIRDEYWMDMLETYYSSVYDTLVSILKAKKTADEQSVIDDELEKYMYRYFLDHFKRYAFYGVMICLHFLPWLLCSEEECSTLSHYFETDMHGEGFRKISIEAGGDAVNEKILAVVRHACEMGYMDYL